MDDLELLVNGMNYAGWTQVGVTRAVDASSGAFTVTLTERWEGQEGRGGRVGSDAAGLARSPRSSGAATVVPSAVAPDGKAVSKSGSH